MINSQDLSNAFARNVAIIKMQTDGLTYEDSLRQLPFHGNCLNWVLGHIAESRDGVLETLGESPLMDTYGVRYKRGSDPMTQADEGTMTLEELLNWLDRSQERIATALSKMDEAQRDERLAQLDAAARTHISHLLGVREVTSDGSSVEAEEDFGN